MEFLETMDFTQKCIFGVVLGVLILVVGMFLYNRYTHVPQQVNVREAERGVQEEVHVHGPGCGHESQSGRGVFVLFFAPWCGHCKTFEPVWDEFTQNFDGNKGIRILKVNADENPELVQMHGVRGFPTAKYCPDGIESPEGQVFNGRSMQELVEYFATF